MLPFSALPTARQTARTNASLSATKWSDGVTTNIGSSPCSAAANAANVSAGAVLRAAGSSTIWVCQEKAFNWSATKKRCSSLVTTIGGKTGKAACTKEVMRATDC